MGHDDRDWAAFWDPDSANRRLLQAPAWGELVDSLEDDRDDEEPWVSRPPAPGGGPVPLDFFLQRTVDAAAAAGAEDSPEAWREVVAAAGVLSDVAQTLAVLAQAKDTGRQLARAASDAEHTAQIAVDAATEAMDKIRHLEAVVAQASAAKSEAAWRQAHQAVMASTTAEPPEPS